MKIVDLHSHTTASDGSYKPFELARYAVKKNLSALAVTDHDTINGVQEAVEEGSKLGLEVIPGVEISTNVDDRDVHLVALFFDLDNEELNSRLDDMSVFRRERNYKMVDKLQGEGINISREDLYSLGKDKSIARGHIAQILIERGYAQNLKEALRKYLSKGTIGYVQKEVLSVKECIELIHNAGGLLFVAHLHQINPENPDHCIQVALSTIEAGADGLETRYPEFDNFWVETVENIVKKTGCLRSGGSDFHGLIKKGLDLGTGYGNLQVPYDYVLKMKEKLNR